MTVSSAKDDVGSNPQIFRPVVGIKYYIRVDALFIVSYICVVSWCLEGADLFYTLNIYFSI